MPQLTMPRLSDPAHVFVIAEAAGSHQQEYAKAEALVHAASAAGADAIKFQTFSPESICADVPILFGHDAVHDAWCQRLGVTRMRQLFRYGGLPRQWHANLKALAESLGLVFLSTPFSVDDARFLVEVVGVDAVKVASGDLTFTPMLQYLSRCRLPLIVSTGGATMREVGIALAGPLTEAWTGGWMALLHCVSAYPTQPEDVNLRCIQTLREFTCPVGFSDHTLWTDVVPALAVACGATLYEKHLRLADDKESVDAGHSLDPYGFTHMVNHIRLAQVVMGDGVKVPRPAEMHDRLWARRSPADWRRPTKEARAGRWA